MLDGDSIFANVLEVNVIERAAAQAVDTLGLVGTDRHTGEGGALLEQEDGVCVSSLGLSSACTAATVVAGIGLGGREGLSSSDSNGLGEGRGGGWGREDVGSSALLQA